MVGMMRRHMLLVEALRVQMLLLEGRIDFLKTKFVPIIANLYKSAEIYLPDSLEHLQDVGEKKFSQAARLLKRDIVGNPVNDQEPPKRSDFIAEEIFQYVLSVDPDPVKKNSQWLLTCICRKNNRMPLEDLQYAAESLTKFEQMRKEKLIPKDKQDINQYKSLSDLNLVLRGGEESHTIALSSERQAMLAQSKVLYDGDDYEIIVPKTEAAACYFGRNTEWCTAWGDHLKLGLSQQGRYPTRTNQFRHYNSMGELYIILNKATNEIVQLSFGAEQYMDVNDRSINISKFLQDNPKVDAIINKESDANFLMMVDHHPVYSLDKGFQIKSKKGLLGKTMINVECDDNGVIERTTGYWVAEYRFEKRGSPRGYQEARQAILLSVFDKLQITGDPLGEEILGLFYRNGKWGTKEEVATVLYRYNEDLFGAETEWHSVKTHTHHFLLLYNRTKNLLDAEIDSDGVFTIRDAVDTHIQTDITVKEYGRMVKKALFTLKPEVSHAITELLLEMDEIKKWSNDSEITSSELLKEDATRLIEVKPELGDIPTAYKIHGASDVVKDMVINWCHHNDITTSEEWLGDKMIIEKFKNVEELINELGDKGAEYFVGILNGNNYLDNFDESADSSQIEEYIENLDSETLKKLGQHLANTYPNEVEDIFGDEYDPTNSNDVAELAKVVDDSDIQDAANSALSDGRQSGAEGEASKIFWDTIKANKYVYFIKTDDEGTLSEDSAKWDTPCCFAIALDELAEAIKENVDLGSDLSRSGWTNVFEDAKIHMEEPHYGFSDFDDKSAYESFAERISDIVP